MIDSITLKEKTLVIQFNLWNSRYKIWNFNNYKKNKL
jgi:hypothetical protein